MIRTISILCQLSIYAKVCLASPHLTYFYVPLSHSGFQMFFISDVYVEHLRNANDKIYYLLNCIRRSVRFTSILFSVRTNCTIPHQKNRTDRICSRAFDVVLKLAYLMRVVCGRKQNQAFS